MIAVPEHAITILTMTVLVMIGPKTQARELVLNVIVLVKMVQMFIRNQRDRGRLQPMEFVQTFNFLGAQEDAEANHWDGPF